MADERPNFTVARCCKTCHYFHKSVGKNSHYDGTCSLARVVDPTAEPKLTYTMLVCDAHTWKKSKGAIHKWALKSGAYIPNDIL